MWDVMKEINVNELAAILEKHFDADGKVYIKRIMAGSINNAEWIRVGVGNICFIEFKYTVKTKE